MPAAAVIPALIVYTKIAAVKKLVVGFFEETEEYFNKRKMFQKFDPFFFFF